MLVGGVLRAACCVLCAACSFDEALLSDIARLGLLLKDGAYVITLTKRLKLPAYRLLDSSTHAMSWGFATIHIQQKWTPQPS